MKKPNILVFYIRISVEDRDNHADGKEESDSIVNQRALLWGYIGKKRNWRAMKLWKYVTMAIPAQT